MSGRKQQGPLARREGEKVTAFFSSGKYDSHSVTMVRQSIPAAGADPVTLFKKLPRKVTNPGDSSLLHLPTQALCIFFNQPYITLVRKAGVKCNEENLY